MNYLEIASKKLEDLSNLDFTSEKNESLKKEIINFLIKGDDKEFIASRINQANNNFIKEINENSNIQIILKNKSVENTSDLLDELIQDHKDQSSLKKIESLEKKLINNLDENSYSELIKLKSQLNRD